MTDDYLTGSSVLFSRRADRKAAATDAPLSATGGGASPSPGVAAVGKTVARPGRQPGARFALLILTCINLLNYVDRCVAVCV